MKAALSTKEFCEAYGVGQTKLYELLHSGELQAKKVDGKTLIPVYEADRWLKSLPNFEPHADSHRGAAARAALADKRAGKLAS